MMGTAFWEGDHVPASQDATSLLTALASHDPVLQIQKIPLRLPYLHPVPNGAIHIHTRETKALLG